MILKGWVQALVGEEQCRLHSRACNAMEMLLFPLLPSPSCGGRRWLRSRVATPPSLLMSERVS